MSQGFPDAVAKFSNEVDAAVSRARRASADAREQSARLRRETEAGAERARAGELKVPADELTKPELRDAAVRFRAERGLPVDEFPPDAELTRPAAPAAPPVPPSGDDDDDFSQEQIMSRI
jgi:hypothetical protein